MWRSFGRCNLVAMMYRIIVVVVLVVLSSQATAAKPMPANPLDRAQAGAGQWVWIPMPDNFCRDGSKTGFGARLLPGAKAVMIYLQGGGACYDGQSCRENERAGIAGKNFSRQKFDNWVSTLGDQGVFNTGHAKNPVSRWNHIYVPYCTGDLHSGNKMNARVAGVSETQHFVGNRNLRNILRVIGPYFRNAEDVALVGASAGGVGVLFNYPQVVEAFNGRSVAALVDSAPVIPETDIKTSCFERKITRAFDPQLPADCPECANPDRGGFLNLYNYLSTRYPQGRFAFASADADLAGVVLYGRESVACGGAGVNIFNYRRSLYALRDKHIGHEWATFLPGGIQHTMTQSDALFLRRKYRGFSAGEWLGQINSKEPLHVPPARLSR